MISIRLFLAGVILASWVLVSVIVVLQGYRDGVQASQRVLDLHLRELAQLLAAHPPQALSTPNSDQRSFAYQIIRSGRIVKHSRDLGLHPFSELTPGYAYSNFLETRWRTYALPTGTENDWVLVAEPENQRLAVIEEIVVSTLQPMLLGLPAAGLAIWFVIGYGLKPLDTLSEQLYSRQENNLEPIDLGNQPSELLSVSESVNQLLNRLQVAFQREKAFVADAAHELRTPVSNLKVHLHNLMHNIDLPTTQLQSLEMAINNLGHLVEQLLTLYRSSPELLANQQEVIEVNALLQNLIAQQYNAVEQRDHDIELRCAKGTLETNRFALTSIVTNLLTNAIKYTPPGGTILVDFRFKEKGWILFVEDSGPGIAEKDRERVLNRFVRIENAATLEESGSGLGLSIVKQAATILSATIRLTRSQRLGGLQVRVETA